MAVSANLRSPSRKKRNKGPLIPWEKFYIRVEPTFTKLCIYFAQSSQREFFREAKK